MKIRKWLCMLLAAAMLLCMAPALAQEAQTDDEEIIILDYFRDLIIRNRVDELKGTVVVCLSLVHI